MALLVLCSSCNTASDRYYLGKQSKLLGFAGADHILAEKKADSLQIWYITDDLNAGYFERCPSEMLPLRPTKSEHFTIKEIQKDKLVVNEMNLYRVSDLKNYYRLRNEVGANSIESGFEDSIRSILQVKAQAIALINKIRDNDQKAKFVSNTHCDSFPQKYRQYLQSNLVRVRAEADAEKAFYTKLINGKIKIDSTSFEKFISSYDNGFYDQRAFYYFIKQKPELFFLQINVSIVEQDVCYCPECFSKDELDTMYCGLKPLRQQNPGKLWMFERQGDLRCQ